MNVDLNKIDLISLVKGISPNYDVFGHELVKDSGDYVGGFHDKWIWSISKLEKMSEDQLWELFVVCRDSWL